jgi:hypothetical protein
MSGNEFHDPEYVAARRVLLDALGALGKQRKAVVLVGAQAIYLHVGPGDMAVAPFTTDGDLALNPLALDDEPFLAQALHTAGFQLAVKPGTWIYSNVQIDFLVPSSLGGPGRRSARLGPHGTEVARKAKGLEAAIIDHQTICLPSLSNDDDRTFDIEVAGVAALIVAKLHKISEREKMPDRWAPKDGLDVLRILRSADLTQVASKLTFLEKDPICGAVTTGACLHLRHLFGSRRSHGSALAVQASAGLEDSATIAGSCEALAQSLLTAWRQR